MEGGPLRGSRLVGKYPVLRWVFRRLSPRISRDFGLLLPHLGFLRGFLMSAILEKLQNTVIAGIVLLVIIVVVVGATVSAPAFDHLWFAFLFRYLHVLSGVMWIGLLWRSEEHTSELQSLMRISYAV